MSIKTQIKHSVSTALKNLGIEAEVVLEHPASLEMGDYSTNAALALAKNLKTNPKELAEKIVAEISKNLPKDVEKVEVAGVGFINFYLHKYFFQDSIKNIIEDKVVGDTGSFHGKTIMVEYTDPNPFKPFHIGHLMTNAIGESIARILEHSGAKVYRANYQGDVGLHVAKAIYALLKYPEYVKKDEHHSEAAIAIGEAYAKGAEEYESPEAKKEIDEINKKIYARSDEKINELYDWGFKVTMNAFEDIYDTLGTQFDYYFLESKMAAFGQKIVEDHKGKIFKESDGALVFKAEEHDPKLHTRVFLTSQGLPTYETKELGLTDAKFEQVPNLDFSIVITANEQLEYMRVVAKALSLIHPDAEKKMKHLTHGMMRFATGKMSSRKGNVITGEGLLRDVRGMVMEKIKDREMDAAEKEKVATIVGVAAIKYGILKQSTGGDIIFDFDKALSFEGDSGPYLQYSYARAKSLLSKAASENIFPNFENLSPDILGPERFLYQFPEVVLRAAEECEPHYIANYLIELAQSFNSFYGNTQIIDKGDLLSPYKLALVEAFSKVMKTGLNLLGIEAPEKM